ncbi:hypothetical protein GCM10010404_68550 [Nonomuraea africana]|uniref:Uncharacterized protein n=1 Tax=Nonomuraea africana TaxID=46171 RepID=A0ABR9KNP1_9ACTN|nr:hypothetical protein [Nonomuraea africana]
MSSSAKLPFPAHADHALPPRFFGLMKATTLFLAAVPEVEQTSRESHVLSGLLHKLGRPAATGRR